MIIIATLVVVSILLLIGGLHIFRGKQTWESVIITIVGTCLGVVLAIAGTNFQEEVNNKRDLCNMFSAAEIANKNMRISQIKSYEELISIEKAKTPNFDPSNLDSIDGIKSYRIKYVDFITLIFENPAQFRFLPFQLTQDLFIVNTYINDDIDYWNEKHERYNDIKLIKLDLLYQESLMLLALSYVNDMSSEAEVKKHCDSLYEEYSILRQALISDKKEQIPIEDDIFITITKKQ